MIQQYWTKIKQLDVGMSPPAFCFTLIIGTTQSVCPPPRPILRLLHPTTASWGGQIDRWTEGEEPTMREHRWTQKLTSNISIHWGLCRSCGWCLAFWNFQCSIIQSNYQLNQSEKHWHLKENEESIYMCDISVHSYPPNRCLGLQSPYWRIHGIVQDAFISCNYIKVKILVYCLALAAAAIHTTLQASHCIWVREFHWTFNEPQSAAHFSHL